MFLPSRNPTTSYFGLRNKRTKITKDIEDVAVKDRPILVLHHTGVVSSVRRHHALHYQTPMLMSQLETNVRMGLLKDAKLNNQCIFRIKRQTAYLDTSNAMLSPKLTPVFEPPDARHGAAHCRAAKLHCVSCWDSVELLLHTLDVCPVGT